MTHNDTKLNNVLIDEDTLEGIYFGMLLKAMEQDPEHAEVIELAAEISRKLLKGREVRL